MAKRSRVARSAHRPGGAAPVRPTTARTPTMGRGAEPPAAIPGAAPRPSQLAASVAIADDRVRSVPEPHVSHIPGRVKIKPNSLLAARAALEYVYVGADLRRIAIVGTGLFAVLIVLWIVLVVVNVSGLY